MTKPLLSIISPVYKAENIVDELVKQITKNVEPITPDFEIILVEDGGPDNSWQRIESICNDDTRVIGIKLSRNFGQHYAITAGLESSSGKFTIIMDCDLQDDPASINSILSTLQEGYDIVFTRRKKRAHSLLKNITSKLYNRVISLAADKKYDIDGGSMIGLSRIAVENFLLLKEKDRLYVQLFKWIGFKQTYIEVPHNERYSGESSYTFGKMISLALQGLTSHSTKLLKMSIYAGFAIAITSFLTGLSIIVLYFTMGFSPGWPSLFVAIAFATGIILMSNGVMGLYIGKTFEQSKNRPLYLIEKKINTTK